MSLLFILGKIFNNMAIVDFGWSINFSLIAFYLIHTTKEISKISLIFYIMVIIWSFRLAFYLLFTRILFKPEEGRYLKLREKWKKHLDVKFFIFFQFQAITNVILSVPLFLTLYQNKEIQINHYIAIIIFIIGFIGESIADFHLYYFKKNPNNKNKTLKTGLWKYSRHPNYFFELVIWFSFGLYHINLEYGYVAFVSFFILLFFILKITGIPATEEQNLSSKGEDYKNYIENTSPLIPLPHKLYKKLKK
ncbi:MAG: DUF1295 domain-containing protein [Leptospiraceae bacterium]|nr:DUF1295 domain-containing protein [Leptospiraceae bacterium]